MQGTDTGTSKFLLYFSHVAALRQRKRFLPPEPTQYTSSVSHLYHPLNKEIEIKPERY